MLCFLSLPPARDLGSRVSRLVFFFFCPPDFSLAVHPALFSSAVLRQALKISDRDDVSSVSDKIDAFIKGSNPLAKHRPLVDVIFGLEVGKWVMNWLDS